MTPPSGPPPFHPPSGAPAGPSLRPTSDPTILQERFARALSREPEVAFAYLFGSVAKGSARAASDVDVAVFLTSGESPRQRMDLGLGLERELEQETGIPVQVVVLNDAPLELRRNVLGHGQLLVARDEAARHRFWVDTGHRYY